MVGVAAALLVLSCCPVLAASLALASVLPLGRSQFSIKQSWSQATDEARQVFVHVHGSGGRPLIFLHGITAHAKDCAPSKALQEIDGGNNVIVYPDGYMGSWNIGPEGSKAPDVAFLEAVVDKLKTYRNVDMSDGVTLTGYSNGCGMVNAVLIESSYPEFERAACGSTSLTVAQYKGGKFFKRASPAGNGSDYTVEVTPRTGRTLWAYHGKKDPLIPWNGGPSLVGSTFMSAPDSIHAWAQHYGAPPGTPMTTFTTYGAEHSFLGGQVKLYEFADGGHDLDSRFQSVTDVFIRELAELPHKAPAATPWPVIA